MPIIWISPAAYRNSQARLARGLSQEPERPTFKLDDACDYLGDAFPGFMSSINSAFLAAYRELLVCDMQRHGPPVAWMNK